MADLPSLAELRVQAAAHDRDLAARVAFYTVAQLAEKWSCSSWTVRAIPFARLPYTSIGRGAKRAHRRYDPADVAAFERRERTADHSSAA